jgi:hypothetical protein
MMQRRFPAVEVRETRLGKGVFTLQPFRKYQIIGDVCGTIVSDPHYDSPYCMELGRGRTLEPRGTLRFLNHSCDPSCELFYHEPLDADDEPPDRLWLKALRPIQAGEELAIDYAWPAERAIPCLCGAANCRGWIVAIEELPLVAKSTTTAERIAAAISICKLQIANSNRPRTPI